MKGVLPCLEGSSKPISENYNSLNNISKINTNLVFTNFINNKRYIKRYENEINDIKNQKLLWYLKDYDSYEMNILDYTRIKPLLEQIRLNDLSFKFFISSY